MHTTGVQTRRVVLPLIAAMLGVATALAGPRPAASATVTASYVEGYRDVLINDYHAPGLGTFRLVDGGVTSVALCIESDVSHTRQPEAYTPVPNRLTSEELDILLWWVATNTPLSDDQATAAAALAWYYVGAQRGGLGVPVWSNGAAGFAAITPLAPHAWDGPLPQFSSAYPVGLRAGGTNIDAAEAWVARLHRVIADLRGAWDLAWDGTGFVLTVGGRPAMQYPVAVQTAADGVVHSEVLLTDSAGRVSPRPLPRGGGYRAWADGPGVHREWDGGGIQRMATPGIARVEAAHTVPAPTTTTTTTTTTTSTTTAVPPTTTSTTTTAAPTTSSTTPPTTAPPTTIPDTTAPPTTMPPTTAPPTTIPDTTAPPTTAPPTTVPDITAPPTTAPPTTASPATVPETTAPPTTVPPTTERLAPLPTPTPPPAPTTPTTTTTIAAPVATLPNTGSAGDTARTVLHVADATFVVGVLLSAVAGLTRRRAG